MIEQLIATIEETEAHIASLQESLELMHERVREYVQPSLLDTVREKRRILLSITSSSQAEQDFHRITARNLGAIELMLTK